MGDILSGFMKSQRGEVIAADATNWFGGPQGTPRWAADLPDKQIGSCDPAAASRRDRTGASSVRMIHVAACPGNMSH